MCLSSIINELVQLYAALNGHIFLASWRILFSVELNYVIDIHETSNRKQSERMMIPKVEKKFKQQ